MLSGSYVLPEQRISRAEYIVTSLVGLMSVTLVILYYTKNPSIADIPEKILTKVERKERGIDNLVGYELPGRNK